MGPQNLSLNIYFKYYVKTKVIWLVIMGHYRVLQKYFHQLEFDFFSPHIFKKNQPFTSLIHTKKHANSHPNP